MSNIEEIVAGEEGGFYAYISWTPSKAPPESMGGHKVVPPREWGMVVHLFPSGSSRDSKDAIELRWGRFLNPKEQPFPHGTFQVPFGRLRAVLGDAHAPEPQPTKWNDGQILSWAHFSVYHTFSGDYTYEIVLYPTYHDIPPLRYEPGPGIVLKTGTLRVRPFKKENAS